MRGMDLISQPGKCWSNGAELCCLRREVQNGCYDHVGDGVNRDLTTIRIIITKQGMVPVPCSEKQTPGMFACDIVSLCYLQSL